MLNPSPQMLGSTSLIDHPDYTWIGTVVGVHGVRGELKVNPLTDTPEYYQSIKEVFVEQKGRLQSMTVEFIRIHKKHWLIKLAVISDRDLAESYRHFRLFLPDTSLRPLEDGEYFIHQLIGCQVEDLAGTVLGVVDHILEAGHQNLYVVKSETGEFLIPSGANIIQEVLVRERRVRIDPMDGLLDL